MTPATARGIRHCKIITIIIIVITVSPAMAFCFTLVLF
jgi:hypothetical protein